LPAGWLSEHPLTESDLLREAEYLKDIGLKLKIRESIPN
jgi:exopolyphosphatase/guanosine-5'-triphosphate,3'-diphosphate pyrophosphatase